MSVPFIDWIWRVRGALPLDTGHRPADAFDKLDPLFQTTGTSYTIEGDTLKFTKKNPAAQDKMATFTRGTLRVVENEGQPRLAYDMSSPALLLCFLAPLLFLGFAQVTIIVGEHEKAAAKAAAASGKDEKKADKKDEAQLPLNWIDKALGAPEPEKPDEKKKKKAEREAEDEGPKGPSPTPAYVFAGIFAALYVVGRILEAWLARRLFRTRLQGS